MARVDKLILMMEAFETGQKIVAPASGKKGATRLASEGYYLLAAFVREYGGLKYRGASRRLPVD